MYFYNYNGGTLEDEEISQVKLWYGYGVSRWNANLTLMDECVLSGIDWLCDPIALVNGMQLFVTIDIAADATIGSTTKFSFMDGVIKENTYTQTVIAATPGEEVENSIQQTAYNPSTINAPQCTDNTPQGKINLFQIDTAGRYVNLYFTKAEGPVTGYSVNFGLTKDANQFGDNFNYTGPEWLIGRKVTHLSPNTTYYFKVRAINGCNAGEWSNVVQIKTKSVSSIISKLFSNLSI